MVGLGFVMLGLRPKVLGAALLAAALTACSPSSGDAAGVEAPRAVKVVNIEMRPLNQGLIATGRLVAREEVAISTQLAGYTVAKVLIDQGASVQKDQPLAELDSTLLDADIAQRKAAVGQAKAASEKARQDAARGEQLKGTGALSQEAINTRLLNAESAKAALAQAQAALDSLIIRKGLMVIRAPVAGRVLSRTVRPGDISAPGTVMYRIAAGGEVEVDAEIPERSMNLVAEGQTAVVKLQSGATLDGKVRLVSAEIDRDTRLGRARVLLPVRDDLRPGGFADVVFAQSETPVRAVREGAVRYAADGATVMALDDANRVSTLSVKIGRRGGGYVELLEGPAPGTRILLGAQGFVLDGDEVTPMDVTAEATP
jgi:HlyD family secretion protein